MKRPRSSSAMFESRPPPPPPSGALQTPLAGGSSGSGAVGKHHLSTITFASLPTSAATKRAMAEGFGYESATQVQAQSIPVALTGKDVLARAKTGTGKTIAFMIPIVEGVSAALNSGQLNREVARGGIFALVISPTRELAFQIAEETKVLLRYHPGLKCQVVIGGTNISTDQKRIKNEGSHILIATPGRLQDHFQSTPDFQQRITSALGFLVLDEADQLLDMGFKKDIDRILTYLPPKETRQTLFFSATVEGPIKEVARSALKDNSVYVNCISEEEEQTHAAIEQYFATVRLPDVIHATANIIEEHIRKEPDSYKIIVFLGTARVTQFFAELFNASGMPCWEIHSRINQTRRGKISAQFRDARKGVLFTSDVSARGMDYPDVSFVLQVGGASSREQYVHRIGRSGRAGKSGEGLLLLCDFEGYFLKEVKDLPLEPYKGDIDAITAPNRKIENGLRKVQRDRQLSERASQAYQAWLGYYNGLQRKLRWNPVTLVEHANR